MSELKSAGWATDANKTGVLPETKLSVNCIFVDCAIDWILQKLGA